MKRITLRAARKAKKLTQAKLAARLGRPQSYIAKIETGQRGDVTTTEARALGKALGVEPFELTFGDHLEVSR